MKGKNNVHFAKEVIDFIVNQYRCYILVGDFSNFFDNLNHLYLKEKLCNVLNSDRLPDDYYAVYKNVTKYSYINLSDIEEKLGKKRLKLNKKLRNSKLFNTKEFQELKKYKLKKNKDGIGIPQGSSISSVYANIYIYIYIYDRI